MTAGEGGVRRPLWLYLDKGVPRPLSACKPADREAARYFCREGDRSWRPIAELPKALKEHTR